MNTLRSKMSNLSFLVRFGKNTKSLLFFTVFVVSCEQDPGFRGRSENVVTLRSEKMQATCSVGTQAAVGQRSWQAPHQSSMSFSGEFCLGGNEGVTSDPVSHLFLFDHSGSMLDVDMNSRFGGSCARHEAMLSAVNEIRNAIPADQAQMINQVPIHFAAIAFGSTAKTLFDFKQIGSVEPSIRARDICGASMRGTNYEGALQEAQRLSQGREGRTYIYFITDGEPTSTNNLEAHAPSAQEPMQKAVEAARSLYNALPNATVYYVYMDNKNAPEKNPLNFENLRQIAKSPDHIARAENVADLANTIRRFRNEDHLPNPSNPKAQLIHLVNNTQVSSSLVNLVAGRRSSTGNVEQWMFETAPIPMMALSGQSSTQNIVKVVMPRLSSGVSPTAVFTVDFVNSVKN